MAQMVLEPIWQKRWTALQNSSDALRQQISSEQPAVHPYNELFVKLLEHFTSFTDSQFHFFLNGFGGEAIDHQLLEHSSLYPPEHVLRVTLDQVAYDLSVIQWAWQQRAQGTEDELVTLKLADVWGRTLLAPLVDTHLDNKSLIVPTNVVTYFQKSPSIRLIPYTNVALVGIPMSATGARRDLLALGHELGHYVYWHCYFGGERLAVVLDHMVRDEPSWVGSWMEEIFSDIFGCLAWGHVAMAASAVDMMRDNLPAHFVHDDGKYPVYALRPYVYIDVLRHVIGSSDITPLGYLALIEQEWGFVSRLRGRPTHFLAAVPPRFRDASSKVALVTAREILTRVVTTIIDDILFPLRSRWGETDIQEVISRDAVAQAESRPPVIEDLYADFEQMVAIKQGEPLNFVPFAQQERWFDVLRRQALQPQPIKMPPDVWVNVFAADGWTIGGPETRPTGT